MQFFQAPAAFHEFDRQPVEQFRMRRLFTQPPEIARRADDPPAEVVHPDPVDQDARDKRMLATGQVAGISQAAAGVVERRVRRRLEIIRAAATAAKIVSSPGATFLPGLAKGRHGQTGGSPEPGLDFGQTSRPGSSAAGRPSGRFFVRSRRIFLTSALIEPA